MTDLISSTKMNLKKIVPAAKDIFIKIEKDHEKFLSKIHVQVPGKVLHAEKKAETVVEAIDSSYHAVLKQIDKIKMRHQIKRRVKKEKFRDLLYSQP